MDNQKMFGSIKPGVGIRITIHSFLMNSSNKETSLTVGRPQVLDLKQFFQTDQLDLSRLSQ